MVLHQQFTVSPEGQFFQLSRSFWLHHLIFNNRCCLGTADIYISIYFFNSSSRAASKWTLRWDTFVNQTSGDTKVVFVHVGCTVTALFVNVMLDYFWTLWKPQTQKGAKYNLNFPTLPHSHPLLDIFATSTWPLWPGTFFFPFSFFFYLVNCDTSPRLRPSQSGCVMDRVYSSSPHCCYGTEGSEPDHPNADVTSTYVHCNWVGGREERERRGGMGRIKWLVYRPPSPWHIMKIKVPEA